MPASRLRSDRVLITDTALADGRMPDLIRDVSVLVEHGLLTGVYTDGALPPVAGDRDLVRIDGSGATVVPAMVDAHAHFCLPGGARWQERSFDSTESMLAVAEENAELMVNAGIRWARDAGAVRRPDPDTGVERALSLRLREQWAGNADRPYIRVAGSWIAKSGAIPHGVAIAVEHGADLVDEVRRELDEGADLVKLYLDGPDPDESAFSLSEVSAAVREAHGRGAAVAAHTTRQSGAAVGAAAGVDSLEHGFEIDADTAATMARNGVALVSTLGVLRSQLTFTRSSTAPRFTETGVENRIRERQETAQQSVRNARAAGVLIAAGSDFGGGSLRANQLAWEAEALVEAGVAPHEALAALTWKGGDLLGIADAGRMTPGRPAHFSLVHGDPLSDPSALWRIWLTR